MISRELATRTMFVKFKDCNKYATAFVIDVEGSQFVATARHLLPDQGITTRLSIKLGSAWQDFNADVVRRGSGTIDDVALLRVDHDFNIFGSCPMVDEGSVYVGQDVYFLGYPQMLSAEYGASYGDMAGAFVKKGALSAVNVGSDKETFVDAINNEGFSGGPVYYFQDDDLNKCRLLGVVLGWQDGSPENVFHRGSDGLPTDQDSGLIVRPNPGLMRVCGISRVFNWDLSRAPRK